VKKKLEYYCVYQDRCHQEVEKKLTEFRLISESKELILIHLIQNNYLNEERFSQSYARGKFRIKKWGRRRIKQELRNRNISTYNIKSAMKEIDEEEYLSTLYELASSKEKSLKEKNSYIKQQKLVQYLYRRGFELDLIREVLRNIAP
jgi:regulatory protein